MAAQRPLELILARNLLSSLSTPALLLDEHGALLFYNDAAGAMLGTRFEDMLAAADWTSAFGPLDSDGEAIPFEQIPATGAVRSNRPYHGRFVVRGADRTTLQIAASAIPIAGQQGTSGAIVICWPIDPVKPVETDGAGTGLDEGAR